MLVFEAFQTQINLRQQKNKQLLLAIGILAQKTCQRIIRALRTMQQTQDRLRRIGQIVQQTQTEKILRTSFDVLHSHKIMRRKLQLSLNKIKSGRQHNIFS